MRRHRFDQNIAAETKCLVCGWPRSKIDDNPDLSCPGPQQQREQMPIDDPDSFEGRRLPPHRPRRWRGDT